MQINKPYHRKHRERKLEKRSAENREVIKENRSIENRGDINIKPYHRKHRERKLEKRSAENREDINIKPQNIKKHKKAPKGF